MNIIEALALCQSGWKVRPECWSIPGSTVSYWVVFHEHTFMEVTSARGSTVRDLALCTPDELLGEWEVVE